jgi:hypothetical protein
LAAEGDGLCPSCAAPFSKDWTLLLVEECATTEHLTHALVRSLRRLTGLPGNLELQPDELMTNLSTEVPWGQSIEREPAAVAASIRRLAARIDDETQAPPSAFLDDIHALVAMLMGLVTILDANQEAVDPTNTGAADAVRDAARQLRQTADALVDGETDLTSLRDSLHLAIRSTDCSRSRRPATRVAVQDRR